MAKELPYFQFEPAQWKFGRIQKRSAKAKVVFIDLICKYWHEWCDMTLEDAKLEFGDKEISELVKHKIIKVEDGKIKIDFLLQQFEDIQKTRKQNAERGRLGGLKKAEKSKRPLSDRQEEAQSNVADKIRLDEIRRDDIKMDDPLKVYFNDLPNSTHVESLAMMYREKKENIIQTIPEFQKTCAVSYPSFEAFVTHFKRWYPIYKTKNVKPKSKELS